MDDRRHRPRAGQAGNGAANQNPADHRGDQGTSTPSPDAPLSQLDERQLGVLRRVGREWSQVCGNPEV
jgi:hypothetical protein